MPSPQHTPENSGDFKSSRSSSNEFKRSARGVPNPDPEPKRKRSTKSSRKKHRSGHDPLSSPSSHHHRRHESPQRRHAHGSKRDRSPPTPKRKLSSSNRAQHHSSSGRITPSPKARHHKHHHSSSSHHHHHHHHETTNIVFSPSRSQFSPSGIIKNTQGSSAARLLSSPTITTTTTKNNKIDQASPSSPAKINRHDDVESPRMPYYGATTRTITTTREPLPIPTYDDYAGGNNHNNTVSSVMDRKKLLITTASGHEQRRRVDEAFLMYTYAEKAAIQIQRNFRNKKASARIAAVVVDKKEEKMKDSKDVETVEDIIERHRREDEEKRIQKEQEEERSKRWTLCFIVIGSLCILSTSFISCFTSIYRKCCKKSSNNHNASSADNAGVNEPITVDGAANPGGATTGGGGGPAGPTGGVGVGGGAAPPPPGLEAMAGQAAASASSAASSGVAAGASAGAAASAASAAAAGTAASAVTAQTVTAVAISSAVVATAATATLVVTTLGNNTPIPTSTCGLVNPDVRKGQFTMIFEGFGRPFDDREKLIVENLVVEAYNNLTIGSNLESVGCLDPLSREMIEAELVNQTWVDPIVEGYNPLLETVFETTLLCDKCAAFRPLFSQETEQERQEAERRLLEQEGNSTINATEALNNGTDAINGSDLLSSAMFEFTSREFFQRMLQLVIFKTEDLSEEGELPEGFVQMTKAFVTPVIPEDTDDESGTSAIPSFEDYLVTEIAYQPVGRGCGSGGGGGGSTPGGRGGGSTGAFQFTYVNEKTGRKQKDVVVVDVETLLADPMAEPVPTTPFPTFAPTRSPTQSPSDVPTTVFSGQPTPEPSSKPSMAPSLVPSIFPSEAPSMVPSDVPSVVPSDVPSMVPSDTPSDVPSAVPTIKGSIGPTETPSVGPSTVPSYIPSEVPSVNPSSAPTTTPSSTPSSSPTVTPYRYVVCGWTADKCSAEEFLLDPNSVTVANTGDPYNTIGVRCCSSSVADPTAWWEKSDNCPYSQSHIPTCHKGVNWYDAVALCEGYYGARLCTRQEIKDQCSQGSGCYHDLRLNWVSDGAPPP